ncbi:hypothetical protein INT47_000776 [Mucor saturninus]|uniref:Uncharacterized protein n=1 Tax=Mucor saturninus TaxID=64648 RepID=A0A8H7UVU9_9FUNG|nr:hypothetical protein INT47_000776 [Mucor saturninus]
MSKSTYSSLSEWVLQTSLEHLFIPTEKLESGFIKQVYYIKNKALNLNCLMFVVSDRFYSIPVLVEEAKALKEFGISNLGEMEIQDLYNHIITFKKSAMAVYLHQSALYPYIIALDWSSPNRKISYKANSQPVYNNPKLKPWIQSLKHVTIPNQSLPSVCFSVRTINALFPHFHLFESIAQKFFAESHLPAEAVNYVAQTSSKSGPPSTPATLKKPVATLKLNQVQPDTRPSAIPTSNSVDIQKEPLNKKKDKYVIRPAENEKVHKSTSSSHDKTNAKKSIKKSTDIVKKTAAVVNSLAPELLDKSKDTSTKLVKKAKVKSKTTTTATTTTKHASASSLNTSTTTPVVSVEGPEQTPAQTKVKTDALKSLNLCAVPTLTPSFQPDSYLYPQNDIAMADPQEDNKALIEKISPSSTPDLSINISSNTRDPLIKSESSSPSLKHSLLYPTEEPVVAANATTVTPTTTEAAKASASVTAVVEAAAALLIAVEATAITHENEAKASVFTNEKKSSKPTSTKGKSSKATSPNKPPPTSTNKNKPPSTSTNKHNLPPADSSSSKPSFTSTNKSKPQITRTNKEKPLSTGTNKDKPLPAGMNEDKHLSIGTNKGKPPPTGTNKDKPLPTGTNKDKPLPTGTNKIKSPALSSQPPDPKPVIKKPTGLTSTLDTTNLALGRKRPPHFETVSPKKAKLVNTTSTSPTPSLSTRVDLADNSDLIEVFSLAEKTVKVRRNKRTTPTTLSKSKSPVIETASLAKVLPQQLNASNITDLHQTMKEILHSEDTQQRKRKQQSVPQEKIPKKVKIFPTQAKEDRHVQKAKEDQSVQKAKEDQHVQKAKEDQHVQDKIEKIHAEDSSSLCRFDRLSQLRNRIY